MTGNIPEGSVVITPAEVYKTVIGLTDAVTQMVAADKAEAESRAEIKTRLGKVEDKVGAIEKKLWVIAALAAASGGGIGSAVAPLLVR